VGDEDRLGALEMGVAGHDCFARIVCLFRYGFDPGDKRVKGE
jgi:hypothetical protein